MAANPKFATEAHPARANPIQYLTENGFRIIRRCDVDESIPKDGIEHGFIVRDSDGYELDITVNIDPHVAAEIIRRSRRRITFESSFWINSAERHLAEYLWEKSDFPPGARLTIAQPDLTDLDLALRWTADNT
jgi:hypothetical protein